MATCAACDTRMPVDEVRSHRCWLVTDESVVSRLLDFPAYIVAVLAVALVWWVGQ